MKLSKTLVAAFILIGCMCVFGQKNDEQLEIGTYIANAYFAGLTKNSGIAYGSTQQDVKIKILSLDNKSNVKAEVIFGQRGSFAFGEVKGKLSGKIDSSGTLRLEGDLVSGNTIYETKLKATVKNNTLVKGKVIMETSSMNWTGDFPKAVIVEEEEEW